MAATWQGRVASWLPQSFQASVTDDLHYDLTRISDSLAYSVDLPSGRRLTLPVEISVGGQRHGLGFLLSVKEIDGTPLARPALVQARYAWSPERKKLLLAPGCSAAKPLSTEPALGLVLSPTFESRCLSCHGQPNLLGTGKNGGVHCESCHGPGSGHLAAIAHGNPNQGVINPRRLSNEESIAICARCHVGLTKFSDPSADDLLVANQVRAIQSSECWVQSGKAFSCTACHDPHNDAVGNTRAVAACLGCHSKTASVPAAICPVNGVADCIGCHMPSVEMGPLHLVDHLIRVHPEQKTAHTFNPSADLRTHVRPISEYLRLIATRTADTAVAARERIAKGESFYKAAQELSVDRSAAIGGYLGRKKLNELGSTMAEGAARLGYGETSKVLPVDGRWLILQRLPRDFRWNAEQLELDAEQLAGSRNAAAAIEKAQQALMIYPQYLRALNFIGVTFAQNGNPKKAVDVLTAAAHLYPDDAGTKFALASTLTLLNDQAGAIDAYRKAIALEPDFTAAYLSLGTLLYASGDLKGATATFREGLQIDPLSAALYYNLGLALTRSGDASGGAQATALALKLDSSLIEQKQ